MHTFNQINRAMRNTPNAGGYGSRAGSGMFRGPLLAPEGDGGGGGGGTITPAGGSALDQNTINTINSAVTSQLKREIEKLPLSQLISQGIANALPAALEGVTKSLGETVSAQIAKLGTGGGDQGGDQGNKGGKGGKDGKPDDAIVKLQSQLDELNTKLSDKDKQLAAQADEQAKAQLLTEARAALGKAGVKEQMIDAVVALHTSRGTFARDKDGAHVTVKRKTSHGEYGDRLSLEKWAGEWVNSDEGKNYIPAATPGRSGRTTGNTGGRQPAANDFRMGDRHENRQQPSPQDRQESDAQVGDALIDWYQSSGG